MYYMYMYIVVKIFFKIFFYLNKSYFYLNQRYIFYLLDGNIW